MLQQQPKGNSSKLKKPSEYAHRSRALIMQSGNFLVNYHGFCLFTNKRMIYLPWIKTRQWGMLPPTPEYGRLKKQCEEFSLTLEQENQVWKIITQLLKNPLHGLTRIEVFTAKRGMAKRMIEKAKGLALKKKSLQKPVMHSFTELRHLKVA
jgi:hypothetical protein